MISADIDFGGVSVPNQASTTRRLYSAECDDLDCLQVRVDVAAGSPARLGIANAREHVLASVQANPWARVVSVSDSIGNAVGLFHTTGPKLHSLGRKYRPLVPVPREPVLRPGIPVDQDVKEIIAGQLDNAQDRFAAIAG